MKYFLLTILGIFNFLASSQGQSGYEINFDIKNYDVDTLVVGYYYGDRNLAQDTLLANKKGKFTLAGEEKLKSGVYLALLRPDNKFFQFMVNAEDQKFDIKVDAENFSDIKFKGSTDNDLFYEYMDYLSALRPKANTLREKKKRLEEENKDVSKVNKELDKMDLDVENYQSKIIKENPSSITALLVKGNINVSVPEIQGSVEEVKQKRYLYYRKHYFDNIELNNSASLRTPFLHTRIEKYLEELTPQVPDSMMVAIDYLLDEMGGSDNYRFYLSHLTNKFSKSKVVGEDAIFVHLIDNYYAAGKAEWISDDNLKKLKDSASRLKPVLIGETIPNITLYKEDGTPYSLSDVTTDFTVIMFWAPDCGHCKKAMPDAIAFNEKFKDKNVTFLAVCTKQGDKYKSCWEAIKEKNMENFINLGDPFGKSRFKRKFNVRTTPKTFILNKDREILMKNVSAKQLDEIMTYILENESVEEN